MKKLGFILALLAMVAFSVPAMAAEWNFYGSARMMTWYESGKAQPLLNPHFNNGGGIGNNPQTDSELNWDLQGNARIGAKVKHGNVSGYFEYGSGPNLRKLYATWKPEGSNWQLLVGQTYTPTTVFYSGQAYAADEGLLAEGVPYGSRKPMIQFSTGGFKLAFIHVSSANNFGVLYPKSDGAFDYQKDIGITGDVDVYLPKIEASYHFASDMWFMDVAIGGQTYKVADPLDRFGDQDINSGLAMIGGGVNFGPAYVKAQFYYGQNVGSYGLYGHDNDFWGKPLINAAGQNASTPLFTHTASDAVLKANFDAAGNPSYDIENTDTIGLVGVVGFKVNDMVGLEAGVGYLRHKNDFFINDAKVLMTYVQAPFTLAKGVFFVPEFGYTTIDSRLDMTQADGISSVDGENFWYLGAKWQINF